MLTVLFRLKDIQVIFLLLGIAMGVFAIVLLLFGFASTGLTRETICDGTKCVRGGISVAVVVSESLLSATGGGYLMSSSPESRNSLTQGLRGQSDIVLTLRTTVKHLLQQSQHIPRKFKYLYRMHGGRNNLYDILCQ